MKAPSTIALLALFLSSPAAHTHEHGQQPFGAAGDPAKVSRTVLVTMSDAMRFQPAAIRVKRGETIKFVVRNEGKLMHEMVIGTLAGFKTHAEIMQKHPGMAHDEPYIAHVKPGKTETFVWHFNRSGEFNFACLVPGHFEAGMKGNIVVD